MTAFLRVSISIAILTILASLPLFFTYQIKHAMFPAGYFFVFMFTAGLVSVIAVPVLLVVELALLMMFRHVPNVLRWHIAAVLTALSAEIFFLVLRRM